MPNHLATGGNQSPAKKQKASVWNPALDDSRYEQEEENTEKQPAEGANDDSQNDRRPNGTAANEALAFLEHLQRQLLPAKSPPAPVLFPRLPLPLPLLRPPFGNPQMIPPFPLLPPPFPPSFKLSPPLPTAASIPAAFGQMAAALMAAQRNFLSSANIVGNGRMPTAEMGARPVPALFPPALGFHSPRPAETNGPFYAGNGGGQLRIGPLPPKIPLPFSQGESKRKTGKRRRMAEECQQRKAEMDMAAANGGQMPPSVEKPVEKRKRTTTDGHQLGAVQNPIVEMVLRDNPKVNFNTCAICGTSFRLTADLVQHARTNHRQSSRYDRQQRTSIGEAQQRERRPAVGQEQEEEKEEEKEEVEEEKGNKMTAAKGAEEKTEEDSEGQAEGAEREGMRN